MKRYLFCYRATIANTRPTITYLYGDVEYEVTDLTSAVITTIRDQLLRDILRENPDYPELRLTFTSICLLD